jgi:hypothetical protein
MKSKAATTLDGYSITVFGPKGATDYSVHNGNYYPADSNKPIDGNKGKGV